MSRPRTVVIPNQHRPHEIGLFVVSAVVGIGLFVAPSPAIAAVFPGTQGAVWAGVLVASCLIGLLGCFWRGRPANALRVEGTGLLVATGLIVWYMLGAWIVQVDQLSQSEITAGIWGTMNLWRVAQIHVAMRELS